MIVLSFKKKVKRFILKSSEILLPSTIFLFRGNKKKDKVFLTLDDGPFPKNTEMILDILRKHDIKATFFMNGAAIEKDTKTFLKVLDDGHDIGNHFYRHIPVSDLNYKELKLEVEGWEKVVRRLRINDHHNFLSRFLRPPFGKLDLKTFWFAWRHRWIIILWSIDTRDLEGKSLDEYIKMFENISISGGDIVLLHDDAKHIDKLLEWIIEKVKSQGLSFCKVSDLLRERYKSEVRQ